MDAPTRHAFVTGATGFVGFNLVLSLVEDGWHVTALHRKDSRVSRLESMGVDLVEGAITDGERLLRIVPEDLDAVFHVAGNTSLWSRGNDAQYRDNVLGTRHVARAALARNARRFVQTSSIAAYGHHDERIDETTRSNAESSPINYHRTKWHAEQELREAMRDGLDVVIINPCHIVGPYDRSNWSRMIRMVHAGSLPGVPPGSGVWCHVREVARAHIAAASRGRSGENYILGGTDASYLEAVIVAAKLTSRSAPSRPTPSWLLKSVARVNEIVSFVTRREPDLTPEGARLVCEDIRADCSKAVRELGYCVISLEEMLADCHRWMLEEGLLG